MAEQAKWMPEIQHCECGQRPWLILNNYSWQVKCTCGCCSKRDEDEDAVIADWQEHVNLQPVA